MKFLKFIIFVLIFLSIFNCFAQTEKGKIHFIVLSESKNEPISSVIIAVEGTNLKSETDDNGKISFEVDLDKLYNYHLSGNTIKDNQLKNIKFSVKHIYVKVLVMKNKMSRFQLISEEDFNSFMNEENIIIKSNIEKSIKHKKKSKILLTRKYSSSKYGKLYDLNNFRMFISPTAKIPEANYCGSTDLFLLSLGITNKESVSLSLNLIPPIFFPNFFPIAFRIKEKILSKNNLDIAISGELINMVSSYIFFHERLIATYGDIDNSFTLSIGGIQNQELKKRYIGTTGGIIRLSRNSNFIYEFSGIFEHQKIKNNLIMFGIRFFGERQSIDLALFRLISYYDNIEDEDDSFFTLPLFNYTYFF